MTREELNAMKECHDIKSIHGVALTKSLSSYSPWNVVTGHCCSTLHHPEAPRGFPHCHPDVRLALHLTSLVTKYVIQSPLIKTDNMGILDEVISYTNIN